ncbi:PIG-L family deacetylase [Candidatus Woesearchaeota archaeon]|nr:PIG-L family deacetylase [Candidatus Woesearchaeota archaeon]
MSRKIVLAIGAHPDDIEYGCGGTLLKHVKHGDDVYILVLTLGEQGEKDKSAGARKKEAENSAKGIGVNGINFGNLKDTRVAHSIETISIIESLLDRINPDIIYTHNKNDTHQDHKNASLSTLSAARNVKTILMYESPSSTHEFKPQFFVSIDEFIEKKLELLKLHTSQERKRYMEIQALRGLAMFRGYEARAQFAEAFEVYRIVD